MENVLYECQDFLHQNKFRTKFHILLIFWSIFIITNHIVSMKYARYYAKGFT